MIVKYLGVNYASVRLILNKIEGATYKYVGKNNLFWWISIVLLVIFRKKMPNKFLHLLQLYKGILPTKGDVLHTFNTVNVSRRGKWVVSFEKGVPNNEDFAIASERETIDFTKVAKLHYVKRMMKHLAKDNCLGLLALSENARRKQAELVKQFPQYQDKILPKLIAFHPAQPLLVDSIQSSNDKYNTLRFIFIGRDFFRKGGREVVKALFKLRKEKNVNCKLTLIGKIAARPQYETYKDEYVDLLNFVENNRDWIEYHEELKNDVVLEKIKASHVSLLPTWMDTYGYSVLESQACGVPIVTTDLNAFREINPDDAGWRIPVPVNELGSPLHYVDKAHFDDFHKKLEVGLYEILCDILAHPEQIHQKAERCIERIKTEHSPEAYAKRLEEIYNGCLLKAN